MRTCKVLNDGAGGKRDPERGDGASESDRFHPMTLTSFSRPLTSSFAPFDVIFRALRLTNEDGASIVRISPDTARTFPPFKLSLKTREEGIVSESGIHGLDLL